jgi:hypothetical protein
MTKQRIKTAGAKVASAAKHAGKKIGAAAVDVGDLNKDGKVDHEDAHIAGAKAKVIASKAADQAAALMKKAGKHDMVRDAAAGAGIGALVALPLPVIGPAVGAAVGAVAGVVKHMRSPAKSTPEGSSKPRKFSVAALTSKRRKKGEGAASSVAKTASTGPRSGGKSGADQE